MQRVIKIAPSILTADFCDIRSAITTIEESGADWIHLDIMDGAFVPNLTFGPKMVADIRRMTSLPLDVHLMIEAPHRSYQWYIDAGADHLTFHIEAEIHAHRLVQQIAANNQVRPGVSLVPSTPLSAVQHLLEAVDIVLVMSVNPGFGGQKFLSSALEKIKYLADFRQQNGYSYEIVVDGGVDVQTAKWCRDSGADVLVSGSVFFNADDQSLLVRQLKGVENSV